MTVVTRYTGWYHFKLFASDVSLSLIHFLCTRYRLFSFLWNKIPWVG